MSPPGCAGTLRTERGARLWRDESLRVRDRWRPLLGPKGAATTGVGERSATKATAVSRRSPD
jgi:hypothetical protein